MPCSSCGASSDSGDRFCAECGASLAALTSGGARAAEPLPPGNSASEIASLGRRIIAVMVDFIACWSVISLIVILIPARMLEDGFSRKGPWVLIPIGLCSLALVYYVLFEALFGATPGKGIAGIQVRSRDGDACDFRAALIRNLLRPVDAFAAYLVGFIVAAVSHSRQRIGDLAAGTIVVRQATPAVMRILLSLAWFALATGTFVACQVMPRR